jgi:hypothetical protein
MIGNQPLKQVFWVSLKTLKAFSTGAYCITVTITVPIRGHTGQGGTFEQNYTSLALQEKDDQQIRDSMQKVMETSVATYVNMSGGAADVAWSMYFGKQFNQLLKEIPTRQLSIANKYPVAANKMSANRHYKEYLEYLDLTKDRLNAIHNSFIDKGDRIVTYLEIQKDLKHHNEVMNNMINDYIRITKLPTTMKCRRQRKRPPFIQMMHKL